MPKLTRREKNARVIERRIRAAEDAIRAHGFTVVYVDYCEDAETPGILSAYKGATSYEKKKVKIATKLWTREEIAATLEHELHHVEDPLWDCGSGGGVFGGESAAAKRRRDAGL